MTRRILILIGGGILLLAVVSAIAVVVSLRRSPAAESMPYTGLKLPHSTRVIEPGY